MNRSDGSRNVWQAQRERGQSLLEVLVALGLASLVMSAAFAALVTSARAKASDEDRASAANAAANSVAELRAATEYDPDALAAIGNATWTVLPPLLPPGAGRSDAAPITLSTTTQASGAGLAVGLTFASAHSSGAATLFLQQYAPPPGAQVFRAGATPAPSP